MNRDRPSPVIASALWAAYGDALGFITELTDEAGVKRRAKSLFVDHSVEWSRVIGGRFGTQVLLPVGCYSDDTQLRLSTSRSIRSDGSFDIEAFSKVELPVFDAYSLGAGNSTKAAAHALSSQSVAWFSNFYRERSGPNYVEAGGNGGLMRIQPHVWCDSRGSGLSERAVRDITRNVICTHGHPRALAGALFHALQLSFAIRERKLLEPADWKGVVRQLNSVPEVIRKDDQLSLIWIPTWEQTKRGSWDAAWHDSLLEFEVFVREAVICTKMDGPLEYKYPQLVERLEATSDHVRGEAMRTAILAQFLAWEGREDPPQRAVFLAVNTLNTDTDTIASMAGALLGPISGEFPRDEILDRDYIIDEATRMQQIANGESAAQFNYPNVLTWHPPRSQLDAVCQVKGRLQVAGLGWVKEARETFAGRKQDEVWQIVRIECGQTLVIKRRARPPTCPKEQDLGADNSPNQRKEMAMPAVQEHVQQLSLVEPVETMVKAVEKRVETLDELTSRLIAGGFSSEEIGQALLRLAEDADGLEKAIAFAAIIVKARRARFKKESR